MKPANPFVKILVASVFFLLMAGFVAYRSGAFEDTIRGKTIPAAKDEGSTGMIASNTLTPYADTSKPFINPFLPTKTFMSSSKSLIIADESFWLDSLPFQKRVRSATSRLTPGSQPMPDYTYTDSGVIKVRIFSPNTLADSIAGRETEGTSPDILPGSKSAPLILPNLKRRLIRLK